MILYHGSKMVVDHPIPKGSNPANDYGPAFYLTLDLASAKEWACRNDSLGIVNKYQIPEIAYRKLKVLDLTDKSKYQVLHWLAILMHFRTLDSSFKRNNQLVLQWLKKHYIDVDQYDVVVGFRADEAYFRFPIRFLSNDLAYEDLEKAYLAGNLGIQYAFLSEKAVAALHFRKAIPCEEDYLGRYFTAIREATIRFDEILSLPRDPKKTYVLDLMRKEDE